MTNFSDLLFFYMATDALLPKEYSDKLIFIFMGLFIVVNAILEASPIQGSPGQILFTIYYDGNNFID